jgi:hypothetical protein
MSIFYISLENLEDYSELLAKNEPGSLELLSYVSEQTPPFANLAMRATCASISSMNLEIVGESPLIALIRGKNEIAIQNLETQKRCFIIPASPEEVHRVSVILLERK